MNAPMPPIPQKTGHMPYALATAGTWFVVNPVLFFIGVAASDYPAVGAVLFLLTLALGFGVPIAWMAKSARVSIVNRRAAEQYAQDVANYNATRWQQGGYGY